MNNEQKNDGTSTPTSEPSATKSMLPSFPCIVESDGGSVIVYGSQPSLQFPTSATELVSIDPALLRGKGTLRLLNIKQALKVAGRANDPDNRKWFNTEVRDVWHKVLKFAARDALANGKPVSLGLSKRTAKKTGQVTLTSKHGFEHVLRLATPTAIADEAAKLADKSAKEAAKETAKSEARAKRQAAKAAKITPVVSPENVERMDALKADLSKAEAAAAAAA